MPPLEFILMEIAMMTNKGNKIITPIRAKNTSNTLFKTMILNLQLRVCNGITCDRFSYNIKLLFNSVND